MFKNFYRSSCSSGNFLSFSFSLTAYIVACSRFDFEICAEWLSFFNFASHSAIDAASLHTTSISDPEKFLVTVAHCLISSSKI